MLTIPLSIYIHLPWCVKKCPYCDFNSHAMGDDGVDENTYIDALIRDIQFEQPRVENRSIKSIFIGGGTPSLFSVSGIDRLISGIHRYLLIDRDCEITLEANPGTAEISRFRGYRDAGVNRLSIGIQSFDDKKLKSLGRIHDALEAQKAITMAQDVGFENINLDIMYCLPGQGVAEAISDLRIATQFHPAHISWYQLTIEPNTVFYSSPPRLPGERDNWAMQNEGQQLLSEAGYGQYEISAYAKQERQCIHNKNYWEFGDYLGIGAGAHGKISDPVENTTRRFARHRLPGKYITFSATGNAIVEERQLDKDDLIFEFMLNACRLTNGFPASLFTDHTALPFSMLKKQLETAKQKNFLTQCDDIIRPTDHGKNFYNDLVQIFMAGGNNN